MVTKAFGDILYYPKSESLKEFPCPENLKKRIILSTKPPKEYLASHKSSRLGRGASGKENDSSKEDRWGKEVTDFEGLLESDKVHNYVLSSFSLPEHLNCILLLLIFVLYRE